MAMLDDGRRGVIGRRAVLPALLPFLLLFHGTARAATAAIGAAHDVRGNVVSKQADETRALSSGSDLRLKDLVETHEESFARLELAGKTTIRMGSMARLLLDEYVAEAGGVLELGAGAMLFDRAEDLPKIDMTIKSSFGLIAVRGTEFFAGPSRGVFGVFVARGSVEVSAAGVTRKLAAGQGVDIASPGQPPGEVKAWGKPRIDEALASVGL